MVGIKLDRNCIAQQWSRIKIYLGVVFSFVVKI